MCKYCNCLSSMHQQPSAPAKLYTDMHCDIEHSLKIDFCCLGCCLLLPFTQQALGNVPPKADALHSAAPLFQELTVISVVPL